MQIAVMNKDKAAAHIEALTELLIEAVKTGALVGYVHPLAREKAASYWHGVLQGVQAGERVLIIACEADQLVGTVQLYLAPEPNAPHRGEVHKLLVKGACRGRGIGQALMAKVEAEAAEHQRSLLLLDTAEGGVGERLYRRMGWEEIGVVPRHFVDPFGVMMSSVYFMKTLTGHDVRGEKLSAPIR